MEVQIQSIKNNPLLGRANADVKIDHEGEPTPSKEDVKDRLAAEQDFSSDKLEVVSIYTGYGNQTSEAEIKIGEEVDEEEYEEKLEEHAPEPQETESEESQSAGSSETSYEDIVGGTISEAKDQLREMDDPDYEAALEAEKDNKNRSTLIDWLEGQ